MPSTPSGPSSAPWRAPIGCYPPPSPHRRGQRWRGRHHQLQPAGSSGHTEVGPQRDRPRPSSCRCAWRTGHRQRVQHGHDVRHAYRHASPARHAGSQGRCSHRVAVGGVVAVGGISPRRSGHPARQRLHSRSRLPPPIPGARPTLRAAVGSVLYLVLVGFSASASPPPFENRLRDRDRPRAAVLLPLSLRSSASRRGTDILNRSLL